MKRSRREDGAPQGVLPDWLRPSAWWVAPAILLALGVALLNDESGVRSWLQLRRDLGEASGRIAGLRTELERTRAEAESLREDRFAQERAIREDLLLARPGETLVRLGDDSASLRNP